ncbi:MAG: acyltransferase [Bacteroidia bacterium]
MNGLRAIAAFVVIIHNIEQVRFQFGYFNHWQTSFFYNVGGSGVTLFFVLSGFLITYLLVVEKEKFKTISVKKFYIRRMLRIWPLYYLVVILSLYIFPQIKFLDIPGWTPFVSNGLTYKTILYFLIFPNVSNLFFVTVPYLGQAWSIGVEEQFYLVWPWIVQLTGSLLKALLFIIVGMLILTLILDDLLTVAKYHFNHHIVTESTWISMYLGQFRISCMAIGGLGAYLLYYKKNKILQVLFLKSTQVIVLLLTCALSLTGFVFPFANHEIYSILFCIIILNVSSNTSSLLKLNHIIPDYLGKISYGLYMFHQLCIVIALQILVLAFHFNFSSIGQEAALYLLSITITVILASVSYYFYEKRFLNIKYRFARVQSDDGNLKMRK